VLQKAIFRSPFVIVPTFVGEVEQDWLYWPLKFRHVAEEWRTTTAWGRLFRQYQEQGSLAAPVL
jgi:hypothetical protein